jgi:hypothetical protein
MGEGAGQMTVPHDVAGGAVVEQEVTARSASVSRADPVRAGPAARFALTARRLGDEARRLDLRVPAFRSPPRVVGADRTIWRRADHVTVAVRSRDRPWPAVLADLIEGVIVANDLSPPASGRVRGDLWVALADYDVMAA